MNDRVRISAKKPEVKRVNRDLQAQKTHHSISMNSPVEQIIFMQRTIGNRAVERLMKSGALQAKLRIGAPGDAYEQEADRVAEQVMLMPQGMSRGSSGTPHIQRACPKCEKDELQRKSLEGDEELQGKATSGSASEVSHDIETQIQALKGGGQPLSENSRAFFEPRFGIDLTHVRVHTGSNAIQMNRDVGARAFTCGSDIYFGAGHTPGNSDLTAHELTHVVQQMGGAPAQGLSMASEQTLQRDLATPPPAVPAAAQPDLTPAQIQAAIAFNRARYNETNTRLIQDLLGGPVTGVWTDENIEAIAATQGEYGLKKDGKVGDATFRFLNREQRLEGMTTSTENCLTAFRVVGPDAATFARETPTRCRFGGHFRTESQFSSRCNCSGFQYRQFIRGQFTRTRGGVVTDLGPLFASLPAGGLTAAFAEDGDVTAAAVNYGHREQPSEGAGNHYIDNTGADDMANGCRYTSEDSPGGPFNDCLPGDRYDLNVNFRGDIRRNGVQTQSKFWTAIRRNNWTP
jgi:hypothetical protein